MANLIVIRFILASIFFILIAGAIGAPTGSDPTDGLEKVQEVETNEETATPADGDDYDEYGSEREDAAPSLASLPADDRSQEEFVAPDNALSMSDVVANAHSLETVHEYATERKAKAVTFATPASPAATESDVVTMTTTTEAVAMVIPEETTPKIEELPTPLSLVPELEPEFQEFSKSEISTVFANNVPNSEVTTTTTALSETATPISTTKETTLSNFEKSEEPIVTPEMNPPTCAPKVEDPGMSSFRVPMIPENPTMFDTSDPKMKFAFGHLGDKTAELNHWFVNQFLKYHAAIKKVLATDPPKMSTTAPPKPIPEPPTMTTTNLAKPNTAEAEAEAFKALHQPQNPFDIYFQNGGHGGMVNAMEDAAASGEGYHGKCRHNRVAPLYSPYHVMVVPLPMFHHPMSIYGHGGEVGMGMSGHFSNNMQLPMSMQQAME